MPARLPWLTVKAGQNKACASHISVGKPKIKGQSRAVEQQAKLKKTRRCERSAIQVAISPKSGAL